MTIFYVVMAAVALIWAVVLIITIFNVLAAIKGKKNKDEAQPNTASTITNIAGMPAQTYHSTYWTNTTTTLH